MTTSALRPEDYFNDDVATFGDRLQAARQAKGLSIDALADNLGVRTKTIKHWENDRIMPRGNRIQTLSGMLDVSMIWLLNGESNGTTHVADTHTRPEEINDALTEIAQLKVTLSAAVEKLDYLEVRLQKAQ